MNNQSIEKNNQIKNIYEDILGLNMCEIEENARSLTPPKYPLTIQDIQNNFKIDNIFSKQK